MFRLLLSAILACTAFGAETLYEVKGRLVPGGRAALALHAVRNPLARATQADSGGRFTFKNVPAGSYTLIVSMPERGEARRTFDVGPAQADLRRRVELEVNLSDSDFEFSGPARSQHSVSAKQLTIPDKALREFAAADKDFAKSDFESGIKRLERAVEIAPQYAAAWNNLGTANYKRGAYARAEECFRAALNAEPDSYQPLVNLGGVLINLGKLQEALDYNVRAVNARPNDALANAQLGQTYFYLGQPDSAMKHLEAAHRIDPGHFSWPQMYLAEIYSRRGEPFRAAEMLEDFLARHPDYAGAAKLREFVEMLRNPGPPPPRE